MKNKYLNDYKVTEWKLLIYDSYIEIKAESVKRMKYFVGVLILALIIRLSLN